MPFGLWTWMSLRNHVLDGGSDPPCKGASLRGKRWLIVKFRDAVVNCTKTAPLKRSRCCLGLTRVVPRKHVLDGDAHSRNLANTIEPYGGDAAVLSNCFHHLLMITRDSMR